MKLTMASNVEISGNLTNYHYVRLGQSISCSSMESIALGYLNIDEEKKKIYEGSEKRLHRRICEGYDQRVGTSKSVQSSTGEN